MKNLPTLLSWLLLIDHAIRIISFHLQVDAQFNSNRLDFSIHIVSEDGKGVDQDGSLFGSAERTKRGWAVQSR